MLENFENREKTSIWWISVEHFLESSLCFISLAATDSHNNEEEVTSMKCYILGGFTHYFILVTAFVTVVEEYRCLFYRNT